MQSQVMPSVSGIVKRNYYSKLFLTSTNSFLSAVLQRVTSAERGGISWSHIEILLPLQVIVLPCKVHI